MLKATFPDLVACQQDNQHDNKIAFFTGKPEIFNTDQGCQCTSQAFTEMLKENGSPQHGRPGLLAGQRDRGETVEECKVRGGVTIDNFFDNGFVGAEFKIEG